MKKRALITGASSGIGLATAKRFAAEGWELFLTALEPGLLKKAQASMPLGPHYALAGDYADPAFVARLEKAVKKHWNHMDALVSCAGVFIGGHTITTPMDRWRRPFDIMVNGAVHVTRLAAPLMKRDGRIVHITSIHGERAAEWASAYAMSKAALNQYCRNLAVEMGPKGILVNAIAPGFVDTPMAWSNGYNELETEWFKRKYVKGDLLPLKRGAQPEEIAGVAWFLCGPDSTYITGQVITVDGGLTITF